MKLLATFSLAAALGASAAYAVEVPPPVSAGKTGKLTYVAGPKGDRVPDFSAVGYHGGDDLPHVPARVSVSPVPGDNTARIQAAIDFVSGLALDSKGQRGAVLLLNGRYDIAGQLAIRASGVVLRGEGEGEHGTVLIATGTSRRDLISVLGKANRSLEGKSVEISDAYVPVGATTINVADASAFSVGTTILVRRPSPDSWIKAIGMDVAPGPTFYHWRAGDEDIVWDRVVAAVSGNRLTLDAPLTTALDGAFGGGEIRAFRWPGRLSEVGVESLRCESAFDSSNPKDEQHAWMAVTLDNARDSWVSHVTAVHFSSSAVQIGIGSRSVTVADCSSLDPVSENAGYRRNSFHTDGQLTLFEGCFARDGRNDFTVGYLSAGPTVFYDCKTEHSTGFSGSIGSWASGVLFDNVYFDGADLRLDNLETWNQGVGWALVNSMVWQSSAARVICRKPPGAANWAVGAWGEFKGDGSWSEANSTARPDSLYLAQLAERRGLGRKASAPAAAPVPGSEQAPSIEQAIPDLAAQIAPKPRAAGKELSVKGGWLVAGGGVVAGDERDTAWWRGFLNPAEAVDKEAPGPAITRFVPGKTGPGWTDDLNSVTDQMVKDGQAAMSHHWGLWYDIRSDDHERTRRPDAEVWPPFFEQPWLRSGQGEAWDRLSRYDLSRYNPWYFARLHAFAELCRQKGLVLIDEMYFQHNILEDGAHYANFPWRTANNLNQVGFPEPPPYLNDKWIKMAKPFYDTTNLVREPLHRAYIRQCLANLADEPNVIHTTGEEYTGPLSFVQYWLDVAGQWCNETGKHPILAISAPKDVQDAILQDPIRSKLISVIDLKYWWQSKAGLFAPKGGEDLSPRQSERKWKTRPSAADAAAMVREYRLKYPDKAVIVTLPVNSGWQLAAAGASFPGLPAGTDPKLLAALARMSPVADTAEGVWESADAGHDYFVYAENGGQVSIDVTGGAGSLMVRQINPDTGAATVSSMALFSRPTGPAAASKRFTLTLPTGSPAIVWISR